MMSNKLQAIHRFPYYGLPAILFITGMLVLFTRNPDPILNPVIYAEDGIWTGIGLTRGWFHALAEARPDYFVSINIILLFLSTKISLLITGNPLALLPQAIAINSYAFYSAVSTFAFFTLKKYLLPLLVFLFLFSCSYCH